MPLKSLLSTLFGLAIGVGCIWVAIESLMAGMITMRTARIFVSDYTRAGTPIKFYLTVAAAFGVGVWLLVRIVQGWSEPEDDDD